MAIPPQFLKKSAPSNFAGVGKKNIKKAAGRRLKAPVPTNSPPGNKRGVATFANPGNKAGQGLTQQAAPPEISEGEGPAGPAGILGALMAAPKKKPKTKVQPAAARKVAMMKMSAGQ